MALENRPIAFRSSGSVLLGISRAHFFTSKLEIQGH